MLKITVHLSENFDDEKNEFVYEDFDLELEHSLVALSKWESEHEKPFLGKDDKTTEEVLSYIKYMILTPEYPSDILEKLSQANLDAVNEYFNAKMTATWFHEPKNAKTSREQITSELIYFWITNYQIPWVVETWHLNRLFTLIKVFNTKNETEKKTSPKEAAEQRRALNAQRRAQSGSKG